VTARFVANPQAQGLLGRTPQMAALLKDRAEQVARVVRQIGPRGDSGEHYVDMIETDVGVEGPTLIGRVSANKFTSGFIEFGTVRTPAFAPLRRAVEAVGLRLVGRR
jgi:hypothetical protein